MADPLKDGEFDLDGFVMGDNEAVYVGGYSVAAAGIQEQDALNPVGHDRLFGRDLLSGPAWTLDLIVNTRSASDARNALGMLASKWRQHALAGQSGSESYLRYRVDGQTRFVWGRPRKFAYNTTAGIEQGIIPVTAEFVTSDPFFYDDQAHALTIGMVPTSGGKLQGPLRSPLTTTKGGTRRGVIPEVGGNAPAPVRMTITGPITNPYIEGDGWRVELKTQLAYDESVTIDSRAKTVLRSDGASLAGTVSRHTRLARVRLSPGSEGIAFGGKDDSGTASCLVQWRPTFNSF